MSKGLSVKKIKFVNALHKLSKTSKLLLYSFVVVLLSIHIFLSIYLADFTWFAAFGALLSIFGLLASFSYSLPLEDIEPKDMTPTVEGEQYVVGGSPLGELLTDSESIASIKQSNIDHILKKYENISTYIIFTVIGTIIWAYAGFLNVFFCR